MLQSPFHFAFANIKTVKKNNTTYIFFSKRKMAIHEHSNGNWQAGKNVLGCNEYMFNNQIYCDVTFKVGTAGKEVKAHKYVLASRSSVFAAMLYGSLSEANDVIAVPDIEAETFNILLK